MSGFSGIERTIASFTAHCEESTCGCGAFNYECPNCHHEGIDYHLYYEEGSMIDGEAFSFECEKCQNMLRAYFDSLRMQFMVE